MILCFKLTRQDLFSWRHFVTNSFLELSKFNLEKMMHGKHEVYIYIYIYRCIYLERDREVEIIYRPVAFDGKPIKDLK